MKNLIIAFILLLSVSKSAFAFWPWDYSTDQYRADKEIAAQKIVQEVYDNGYDYCIEQYPNDGKQSDCILGLLKGKQIWDESKGKIRYNKHGRYDFHTVYEKTEKFCKNKFMFQAKQLLACLRGARYLKNKIFRKSINLGLTGEVELECGMLTCGFASNSDVGEVDTKDTAITDGHGDNLFDDSVDSFSEEEDGVQAATI